MVDEVKAENMVNPFDTMPAFEQDPLTFDNTFEQMGLAMSTLPEGHSTAYLADKAVQMSLIKRATDKTLSQADAYSEAEQSLEMSPDVLQTMNATQMVYAQSLTEDIRGIINQEVQANPNLAESYNRTVQDLDLVETQYEGLLGANKALADAYSKESPLDRYTREQVAKGYSDSLFKEWAEERGVLDKFLDVGGLLIDPASFTFDAQDLATTIDPEVGGNGIDNFVRIVAGYQSVDPELKEQILPELLLKAADAYDNNEYKLAAFVGLLNDPDFFTESYITGTLEAVELGTMLATAPLTWAYKSAKSMQRVASMRQRVKALGDTEAAVSATRTKNRSQLDEALDADATNWENTYIGTNATDGLSPEYQRMTDEIKAEVVAPMKNLQDEAALIKVEALTDAEKDVAKANYLDALNKDKNGGILNAEVVDDFEDGFTVRYQMQNNDDGLLIMKRDVKWTVDDAGSLIATDEKMNRAAASVFGQKLLSPATLLKSIDDNIVDNVTFGGLQSARLRASMAEVWSGIDKGLNAKSKQAVDELLVAGDEFVDAAGTKGTVWKAGDMLAGNVQTISGKRKYTMAEVKAYSAKRAFLDEAFEMQNHIVRRKLEFQGYKEASWVNPMTGIRETQIAKPFKDGRGFTNDITEDIIAPGIMGDKISVTKRGTIDVAKAIEDGYTPVQFLKPIKIDGKSVKYGLIRSTDEVAAVKDLPRTVLNRVNGYVPRISKAGYYYVKDTKNGLTTVARFKTKENAQKYVDDTMAEQSTKNVPADQQVNLQVLRDRDMSATDALVEDSNAYGGLYTGARNKQGIFEGDDLANEITRMSTGQSVQRMVDSIATQMPLNEYRVAVVEKWKNTVRDVLKKQGVESDAPVFRNLEDPSKWKEINLDEIVDNDLREALKAHRTYMVDSLRLPSNQENNWSNFMMNIADRLPNSKVRDLTVNLASKSPLQSLKGATFDAYLGWFNPRQLYVQMQNASLAASMYPTKAPKAVAESFLQRVFLYTPEVDKELLKRAAKGVDVDDIDDMALSIEQFKKSGLRDGVMRTGDYGANLGGFSQGTVEGYRKLAGAGRIFFEEGESMARLISWNIARRNWKEANPGKAMDDKAIRAITDDTLRMNMNMQRENAAWWQKNAITSIPTQFLQVQAKLVENTIGGLMGTGRWSRKEASNALIGQVLLYGTAGVPIANEVSSWGKENLANGELLFAQENPALNTLVDKGMIGVLFNSVGFENDFSEPGSIIAGLDDNIVADLVVSLGELAMGESRDISFSAPSVGVAQRGVDALASLYEGARDIAIAPSLKTVGDAVASSIDSIAAITSTWSNARKLAYLHKIGGIPDKRGNIMISVENLEDTNFITLLGKAMGMPMDIEKAFYEQKVWNYDRKKAEQESTKALKQVYNQFRIDGNFEKFQANKSLILSEYENQPIKRQEIINRMIRNITESRSSLDRDLKTFITDYVRSSGKIGTKSFQATLNQSEPEQE